MRHCPSCRAPHQDTSDRCWIDGSALVSGPDPLMGVSLNHYEIRSMLGLGTTGPVYAAQRGNETFAIKVLFGERAADPRTAARFCRAAVVTRVLSDPHLVRVMEAVTSPKGLTYTVMDYAPGRTLAALIRDEAPLAPARAADFTRQLVQALSTLHAARLVHRDVKPSNVVVNGIDHEALRLLDLGIVLPLEQEQPRLTGAGHFVGTPLYMAPEQASDPRHVGPPADLYALGGVLYEMLSGRPPFNVNDLTELLLCHAHEQPPPLPASEGLEHLAQRLLLKAPMARPTAQDVILTLDRLGFNDARTVAARHSVRPQMTPWPVHSHESTIDQDHNFEFSSDQ